MKNIATLGTVLVCIPLILLSDGAAADDGYDVAAMLAARHPSAKLAVLKEGMRENVDERWHDRLMEDASQAATYNEGGLYPHPILQSYVNLLGQSLLPEETPPEVFFSFKIIEDPIPYADSLATGSVFISSGMVSLLDNEAQLAFILMHEAGHVLLSHHLEQVIEEERVANRTKHIKKAAAVAGAVFAPGLLGGSAGGGR